jgi:TDG/mug DNA glycosylase family protein
VEYLKRHGIALWDVLYAAERKGSLDSNIRNEEFNDIEGLITRNPSIEVIATNGGKAEKAFRKYLRRHPSLAGIKICFRTSTSSMSLCSGWTLERLIDQWREIL